MAKIPASIQREIDEAEALERELTEQVSPPEEVEAVVNDQITDAVTQSEPEVPAPSAELEEETWEQRYRVLLGKYDAEVPRLHAQVRELTDNLNQLMTRLQSEPVAAPIVPQSEVSPEDIANFGEDIVDLARRIAAAEAARQIAATTQRVDQVEGRVQETERDRFYSTLTMRVPNWGEINREQGWLQWLGEYDPIAGVSRQRALDSAQDAMDVDRVAAIFNAYVVTRQHLSPPTTAAPSSALQEQLVPRSQGTSNATPSGKRVYTEAETQALLSWHNLRRLSAEQQDALEQEIQTAYLEGRVAA